MKDHQMPIADPRRHDDAIDQMEPILEFIAWADHLKKVLRQSFVVGGSRRENSAEHSWHACLAAMILPSAAGVDRATAVKMLIIHDLVEILAGDTYAHDQKAAAAQPEREEEAAALIAERVDLFFPEFRSLWREFASHSTPEAKFARAVDATLPILINSRNDDEPWKSHGTTKANIYARIDRYVASEPDLADRLRLIIAGTSIPDGS